MVQDGKSSTTKKSQRSALFGEKARGHMLPQNLEREHQRALGLLWSFMQRAHQLPGVLERLPILNFLNQTKAPD